SCAAGRAAQEEAFRMHIELAKDLDLPMQIHDREAHAECMRILRECGAPERTVFHCFSGDREMAEVCAENGWHASFAGPISYPANEALREAFMALPEELILVETDAPYLAPVPWRGHPNAPYASAYTARFMADLRGVDEASWCEALDRNARRVYGV
ncbi:MAG: TatD family hydrolase, partial [Peptidiphaga gingivicola]